MTTINLEIPKYLENVIVDKRPYLNIKAAPVIGIRESLLFWMIQHGGGIYIGPYAQQLKLYIDQTFSLYPRLRLPKLQYADSLAGLADVYENAVIESPDKSVEQWAKLHIKHSTRVLNPIYIDNKFADYRLPVSVLTADEQARFREMIIDDFTWRHEYELRDDEALQLKSFKRFAHERLYLRTDKPKRMLTEHQREHIVSGEEGALIVPFDITGMQKRYLAIKRAARRKGYRKFLLLKYRRGGFTTLEQALSYQLVTHVRHSQVVTLAHTNESTKRIFRIVKKYHEMDPMAPEKKGVGNATTLELAKLDSLFFIGTAGSSGFGRGDTLQRVHGSEVSKWCVGPQQYDKVTDLVAGLTEAASYGEVILETTPNGHEWFCQTYKDAKKNMNDWYPIFLAWFHDPNNRVFDYNEEELRDTLTDQERTLIEKHKLDWAQIAFRRSKKTALRKLFAQEYPEDDETCFITSGDPFFDVEFIIALIEGLPTYKTTHVPGGYQVIWKQPEADGEYVIGMDTSEGLSHSDPNGLGVLDKKTGQQVAAIHGRFDFDTLAKHGMRMSKMYNDALIGCERNNHGHAVLQRMLDLGGKSHLKGGNIFFFRDGRPGWDTNAETRPILLDELAEAVEDHYMKVFDQDFLGECLTFKKQSNGKYEADPGTHDDTVLKWGIAWQMRKVRRPRSRFIQVEM